MKSILAILMLASVASAQTTWVSYKLTSFPNTGPGVFTATTNFTIPTNTIARIANGQASAGVTGFNIVINYSGLPPIPSDFATDHFTDSPILGPATVTMNFVANTGSGQGALALVSFEQVNGTASLGGVVQPAGFNAVVSLQTSTNLTTWSTITNASFGKTNANRFFRTSLTIP